MAMTDFDEQHPRGAAGQFTEKAQGAPEVALGFAPPATGIGPRIVATIQPQYWRNDYAVDAGATVQVDVTEIVNALSPAMRASLEDSRDSSDDLYLEAVRLGIAKAHDGPFYVQVTESIGAHDQALADPELGEFLFGNREDLNADQIATVAIANTLFPGVKPNISVHDKHAIDVIYSRITEDGDIETVRILMNEAGQVTDGGFGQFWEDDDVDHPAIQLLLRHHGTSNP
jgi:hypothetical protein